MAEEIMWVEIEFIYDGISTIIQCNSNQKMKNICRKFKEKVGIDKNRKIFYTYDGNVGIDEELAFRENTNSEDKKRNKMSILVFSNDSLIIQKENGIKKSKNILCPKCKENIKMDIKEYKINLYDCKNRHEINNILLYEFKETQKIDNIKIVCDICKNNNKSISYNNIF